ncbi:glycoside hydrolase family 66 protein [Paenibacillus sp. MMS20-IR301]|uniref:glycoside hydrolase family 66 protein n=1 Tax=Paenibacillus sp. MMS20-IR301 TaxID=2895946 RepID=UPI0028F0FEF0|nr:glycoside hydrolase family 66 protein [Paenibacillus sp. MMS20-IR301]WNS40796.1 glycoside hydrolase family 66 protein [Paenibacillus sp. MMS20-IR301]
MFRKLAILYLCLLLLLVQTSATGYARSGAAPAEAEPAAAVNPKILKMVPSKARFAPGEAAELILTLNQSAGWSGKLHLQIYQLNTLVAEGSKDLTVLQEGSNMLTVGWTPPAEDFRGYTVKAWIEGAAPTDYATAAIDVSSDWTHFPRYGYVADFPQETAEASDAKLKELSQDYYINAYQFYDWMWRHDVSVYSKTNENGRPLTDADGSFLDEDINADTRYADLLGRSLYPLTVKQQVEAAQKYGSAAMAYQMNYAARENYEDFGVSPEWGLYNTDQLDKSNPQKEQNGYTFDVNGKTTSLFLQDPGNTFWQDYITKQFDRSINTFGFNGIHLDQWGANDNNFLYDYNGNKRYYSLDYAKLIGSVKDSLLANNPAKSNVTFNMVGGNAEYSAVPNPETKTDFDYSEIWQDRNHYRDIQKVVEDTRIRNGGKAMVIAGYMNYKEATGLPARGTEAQGVPLTLDYQSRIAKAYGWVGNFGRKDTDAVTFTVNAPADGMYSLILNYGQGNGSGSPEGQLLVNGEVAAAAIPFDAGTGWGNPTAQAGVQAMLKKGENSVKLTLNTNNLWLNLASLEVLGQGMNERYEAVEAKLDNVIVDQYSHVYYFDTTGDYVKFYVNVPAEGEYPLGFSYASDWQAVKRDLLVNDVPQGEVSFAGRGTWDKFSEQEHLSQVHLKAGDNVITLKANTDDLGIKLKDMTVGAQKYYALYADTPQTNSIRYSESKTDNFGQAGQTVTYNVYADRALDTITVLYHGGNEPVMSVLVDGEPAPQAQNITFPATAGGWDGQMQPIELPVFVQAGHHSITLKMESSGQYVNVGGILAGGYEYSTGGAETTGGVVPVTGYAADFNNVNDRVAFTVKAAQSGMYDLGWVYQNEAHGAVTVSRSVYVNNGAGTPVSFVPTAGSGWGEAAVNGIALTEGENRIVIKMTEGQDSGIRLDRLKVTLSGVTDAVTRSHEAESTDTVLPFSLYKDTVLNFGEAGQQVSYPVTIPQPGEQSLIFTYSNAGGFTTRSVYIDGVRAKDEHGKELKIGLDGTESLEKYSGDGYVIVPHMEAGAHTVTLKMEADDVAGSIRLRGVTAGYFNEPSVRLMDAGLAAMGATHIELGTAEKQAEGPNMLAHEYYPNRSKKMLESTKEAMQEYYKFNAAYENLLFDSKPDASAVVTVEAAGGKIATSQDAAENTLWTTVRQNDDNTGFERYEVLHLINLLHNDDNWRNAADAPAVLNQLKVSYDIGISENEAPDLKVYAASPDTGQGLSQELNYTWNGEQLQIELPSLEYWTMIYIDKAPKTAVVQPIFSDEEPGLPTPMPTGTPAPAATAAPESTVISAAKPMATPEPESAEPGTLVLQAKDVSDAVDRTITIAVNEEKYNRILLPVSVAEGLQAEILRLQGSRFTLDFRHDNILQLLEENKGKLTAGSQIQMIFTKLGTKDVSLPDVKPWIPAGPAYEFEFGVTAANKDLLKLAAFRSPVQLTLKAGELGGQVDLYPLLGIYSYNEQLKKWDYVSGRIDTAKQEISAELSHFSLYTVFAYDKTYADVPGDHWAYKAIHILTAKHVINGMTENTFNPSAKVTRAQFTALLAKALQLKGDDPAPFTDVAAGSWYAGDVAAAYQAGIITGRSGTRFAPNEAITRQEMAVILAKALDKAGGIGLAGGTASFRDSGEISAWAQAAVQLVQSAGLMKGYTNGAFKPGAYATRAEAALTIEHLIRQSSRS